MSGRRRNSAASAVSTVSPPDSRSTRSSRSSPASPSRSSQARARSSTSQSSPTAAKASSPAWPASMACSAALAAVTPSRSDTVRLVPRVMACGRYPTSPRVRTSPEPGRSSAAISRSRVDLPEPLTPISPVRPGPNEAVRPERTGTPSGQLKLSSEHTMAAVIRRLRHVGKDFRYVWRHHAAGQAHVSARQRGIAELRTSPQLSRRRDQGHAHGNQRPRGMKPGFGALEPGFMTGQVLPG